mgnify:CR=1 FL=1
MEKLEKYSLDAVEKTLEQCSGIKICVVSPTMSRARALFEYTLHSCTNEIERYSGFKLEFKNGSVVTFMSSGRREDMCGVRFHQVFVESDVPKDFVDTVCRPLTFCFDGRNNAIFRQGTFELFSERDAVNQAATKVISLFFKATNIYQLQNALRDAAQIVEGV